VGAWVLPQGEFGLDVIAFIGQLRAREQRSVPQIHQALLAHGVAMAERSVTVLVHRYERSWWRCTWPMRPSCAHGCARRAG
jgi:hypothetical protein